MVSQVDIYSLNDHHIFHSGLKLLSPCGQMTMNCSLRYTQTHTEFHCFLHWAQHLVLFSPRTTWKQGSENYCRGRRPEGECGGAVRSAAILRGSVGQVLLLRLRLELILNLPNLLCFSGGSHSSATLHCALLCSSSSKCDCFFLLLSVTGRL